MNSWEPSTGLTQAVRRVLGSRAEILDQIAARVDHLDEMTQAATTLEVILSPVGARDLAKIKLDAQSGERWLWAGAAQTGRYLAVDEFSDSAATQPASGVVYPPVHSQLTAWWLFHAWRIVDLLRDTVYSVNAFRLHSAAVTARALIESTGCLAYEAKSLAAGWDRCKQDAAGNREELTCSQLGSVLARASLSTRLQGAPDTIRATNILTYVDKLAKVTKDARFKDWYDWLSDAAHPAFGARIALATDPVVHNTRAVTLQFHARHPFMSTDANVASDFEYPILQYTTDATIACELVANSVLNQSLAVVDDFGLTTSAATLTRRTYWRNLSPTRGNRPCPCGCGKWRVSRHFWGMPAPQLSVPPTSSI